MFVFIAGFEVDPPLVATRLHSHKTANNAMALLVHSMRSTSGFGFLIGYGAVTGFNVGDEKPPHYYLKRERRKRGECDKCKGGEHMHE
jgi:hypothetical protein